MTCGRDSRRDEHVSTNAGFLLKGNDFDVVDAHMDVIDDVQSHTSADGHHDGPPPSHESDSVPPGLNGHNGSVHENDGPLDEGDHDIAFPSAPQEPDATDATTFADHVELTLAPDSTVSDAAAEPSVSTPRDRSDSNGPDSTETRQNIPLQRTDTLLAVHTDADEQEVNTQLVFTQPPDYTESDGGLDPPMEPTQPIEQEAEHLLSPTTSTATLTLPSVDSTAHPDDGPAEPPVVKSEHAGTTLPSANRLSISYAAATRRLVIDAGVVEKLKVFRQEARIEVHMNISKDEMGKFRGILVSPIQSHM